MSTLADPLAVLIRAWAKSALAGRELTARKLLALAHGDLRRALHATATVKGRTNPAALGAFLAANKNTLAEGFRIRSKLDTKHHTQVWRLERMSESELRQSREPAKPAPELVLTSAAMRRQENDQQTELTFELHFLKGAPTAAQIADAARVQGAQAAVSTNASGSYSVHVSAGDPARLETIREALTRRFGNAIVGVTDGPPVAPARSTLTSRMAALGVTAMSPTEPNPFAAQEAKARRAVIRANADALWRR
jgi:hypothetical protein